VIKRYDTLAVQGGILQVIGPLNAGEPFDVGTRAGPIRAIWIDPNSEIDAALVFSPNLPYVIETNETARRAVGTGIIALIGGVSSPSGTATIPFARIASQNLGSGVLITPGAPLIADLDGSTFVVPARVGLGDTQNSLLFNARLSIGTAWKEMPQALPSIRSPINAWASGNPSGGAFRLRMPTMGRKRIQFRARNNDGANAMTLQAVGYSYMDMTSPDFATITGNIINLGATLRGIWEVVDFWADRVIPDWIDLVSGGTSTTADLAIEAFD